MNKIVSGILFALLLGCMLTMAFDIQPSSAKAVSRGEFGQTTSKVPIRELSWTQGDPFSVINGHVIFPPLPPSEPTPSYDTHWYAGSIYPSSLAPQNASSISMSIAVPPSLSRSDEFYYVLLSAFDSNGSYDQIGFSACYGTWGLTYSWTSGSPYPGRVYYHFDQNATALSPGVTYTFNITTQAGITHFIAYQGSNKVWSLDAPTGGNYLILSNYYPGGIRGRAPYDYTDYEEVWQTSTPEGAPAFDFTFCNNSWIAINGSRHAATWTPWYSPDKSILLPSNVAVIISGDSVLVKNPGAWWPMFHHDLWHNGYSISTAPHTNQTRWSYTTGLDVLSSPAVADGVIFVGSYDDKVYALNVSTGTLVWSYATGGAVNSSPAVAGGVVFVGSNDDKIYALNATTGALIWSYTTGDWVCSSPAVAGGVVFVGSNDGRVYALNTTTGTLVWSYTTGYWVYSSPTVAGGCVYVGSYDHKVYALNATTGTLIWSYATGNYVYSSPAITTGGLVIVGSIDHKVYALNASTGTLVWSYTTDNYVDSSPAVAAGMVFVGSEDGKVYALNASTGTPRWSYQISTGVWSSPAVAGGMIFVGSGNDGIVYALNASTGTPIWSYTTGGAVYSSPAVADGCVYVGSEDGKLYAFGVHDVSVTEIAPFKTIVGRGFPLYVQTTVTNHGSYTETFDVTLYANTTAINQTQVTLTSENSINITLAWNTGSFAYGNYTISAYAQPVPGETKITDNNLTGGTVKVTIPGDINGDFHVDIRDATKIGFHWQQHVPPAPVNVDTNCDGIVNIKDATIIGLNWQKHT